MFGSAGEVSTGMQPGSTLVYTFKSWVPTYAFWMGVIQLMGLNLLGIAWLIWSKRMEVDPQYQPKWMFRFHWFFVLVHALVLLISLFLMFATPEDTVSFRINGAKIAEVPIWVAPPVLLTVLCLYALGLRGIRRERRFRVAHQG